MIYQLGEKRFAISSRDQWLPGIYSSERAAHYAFIFQNAQLQCLVNFKNYEGDGTPITFEDLQDFRENDFMPYALIKDAYGPLEENEILIAKPEIPLPPHGHFWEWKARQLESDSDEYGLSFHPQEEEQCLCQYCEKI